MSETCGPGLTRVMMDELSGTMDTLCCIISWTIQKDGGSDLTLITTLYCMLQLVDVVFEHRRLKALFYKQYL